MKNFYRIRTGDTVHIKGVAHTVLGKSIGRDWCALRTNHGLIHVSKNQSFEVVA